MRTHHPDHWYVVFDSRDGRVVHVHQFICADDVEQPMDPKSREALALEAANERVPSADLRVMPVPAGHRMEPGVTYRVDTESERLVEDSRAGLRAGPIAKPD